MLSVFKRITGLKLNRDVAEALNISQANLSNRLKRGTVGGLFLDYLDQQGIEQKGIREIISKQREADQKGKEENCELHSWTRLDWLQAVRHHASTEELSEARGISSNTSRTIIRNCGQQDYLFAKEWIDNAVSSPEAALLFTVEGEAMLPTIRDRDIVMIDTGATALRDGMVFAIKVDSTVLVKRLSIRPGNEVQVISDNREEYDPYIIDLDSLNIIGEVVWLARQLP